MTMRDGDLHRLNAFVDGELTPAERAEVATRLAADPSLARAHAVLAQLKACVQSMTADGGTVALPRRRRSARRPLAAAAAGLATLAAVGLWSSAPPQQRPPSPLPTLTLTSLPTGTVLPHLEPAGLTLTSVAIDGLDDRPVVTARYVGAHGCRLDLRVRTAGRPAADLAGTARKTWTVDDLTYELVAHGMPAWRFALIVAAAEGQTRIDGNPGALQQRLREARAGAPPCTG
jgi:hypothetical protein